jgi:hypothetical protein
MKCDELATVAGQYVHGGYRRTAGKGMLVVAARVRGSLSPEPGPASRPDSAAGATAHDLRWRAMLSGVSLNSPESFVNTSTASVSMPC